MRRVCFLWSGNRQCLRTLSKAMEFWARVSTTASDPATVVDEADFTKETGATTETAVVEGSREITPRIDRNPSEAPAGVVVCTS